MSTTLLPAKARPCPPSPMQRIPICHAFSFAKAKLLLYHGWADPEGQAQPTIDYYQKVLEKTFHSDAQAAREKARIFMFPGMGHCGEGPGQDV